LHAQITALEDKIKKLIDDNKDINELQNQNKTLKETIRKQDKEIYDLKIKNEDIESAYDRLKKDFLISKKDSGSFEDSLADMKKKMADDDKVIQTLTAKQSELNAKITALTKEKTALDGDTQRLKGEIKELK
jgi:chromosome segregation ATPase